MRSSTVGTLLAATCCLADKYAVLVAGSKGYANYRHQADIAHAYKILTDGGFKPENIITMMANDIASSPRNPFRGQLFNRPDSGGTPAVDVYAAVKDHIDYEHHHVTATNFVKVLTGDTSAPGPVLKSGEEDEVFVYFADHGGVGLIAFPAILPGLFNTLAADTLNDALKTMSKKKMFKKLVFYMEACESGSMFDGLLDPALGVYAVTAANAHESSWGWYCSGSDMGGNIVHGTELGVCLGDLFSINWMENTDATDAAKETLSQQFVIVQNATFKSHVQHFGNLSYINAPIATFLGVRANRTTTTTATSGVRAVPNPADGVDSRDAMLHYLRWRVAQVESEVKDATNDELVKAMRELAAEEASRRAAAALFAGAWRRLTGSDERDLLTTYRPPRLFDCHRAVQEGAHLAYTDYSLKFHRVVVNLCEMGYDAKRIIAAFAAERESRLVEGPA